MTTIRQMILQIVEMDFIPVPMAEILIFILVFERLHLINWYTPLDRFP